MSRWYRAYEGTVTDAKLGEVALVAECSRSVAIAAWHCILESCANVNQGGKFDTTPRRVAVILGEPLKVIEAVFAEMQAMGMVADGSVPSWSRRQFESDSSTERSRKHRETKRNTNATLQQRDATPPYTETDTEKKEREEKSLSDFDRFMGAYPVKTSGRTETLEVWDELSPDDQSAALAGVEGYSKFIRDNPTTSKLSPKGFLEKRRWEAYQLRPSATPTVFVPQGSKAWNEWVSHRGKPPPVSEHPLTRKPGWYFPSEYPPSHGEAA